MTRWFARYRVAAGLLLIGGTLTACRQPLAETGGETRCAGCVLTESGALPSIVVDDDDAGYGASLLVAANNGESGLVAYTARSVFGDVFGEVRIARWRADSANPQLDIRTIADAAAEKVRLLQDAGGRLYLVAVTPGDTGGTLSVYRAPSFGSTWELAFADPAIRADSRYDAVLDAAGALHVAWIDPPDQTLRYANIVDGEVVVGPVIVDGGDPGDSAVPDYTVAITVDSELRPRITYQDSGAGQLRIAGMAAGDLSWVIEVIGRTRTGIVIVPDEAGIVTLPFGYVPRLEQVTLYENLEAQPDERLTLISDTQLQIADVDDAAEYALDYVEPLGGDYGRWSSIAVDEENSAHVAIYDFRKGALWYARQVGSFGSSQWTVEAVDIYGLTGDFADLKLVRLAAADEPRTIPVIAYQDVGNSDLMLAWRGIDGWQSHVSRIDAAGLRGFNPSLQILSNGRAIIAHRELDPYVFQSRLRLISVLFPGE